MITIITTLYTETWYVLQQYMFSEISKKTCFKSHGNVQMLIYLLSVGIVILYSDDYTIS